MLLEFTAPTHQKQTMPSTNDAQLRKQTLDIDPEINFIPWELNIQYVAAATARSMHPRGLLSLVLNQIQWNSHVSSISVVHGQP